MAGGSLNLKQVFGGTAIKQGDTNTRLGYELLDKSSGPMYSDIMSEVDDVSVKVVLTELKSKASIIITDATVKTGTVIFTMPAETTPGRYDVEVAVTVKGQTAIFPSSYASVTLDIVKSYLLAPTTDTETKYINIGSLPSASDISRIYTQLNKLQDEIKDIDKNNSLDSSSDISRIDSEIKLIQSTINNLPTKEDLNTKLEATSLEPINKSIKSLEANIESKASKEELTAEFNKYIEEIRSQYYLLKEEISAKASATMIDAIVEDIESHRNWLMETDDKIAAMQNAITRLTTRIEALESKTSGI